MKRFIVRLGPVLLLAAAVAGCATPDKPSRATLYDFGPYAMQQAAAPEQGPAPLPLVLADIETAAALDGAAVLYRLGYADANQLRPYAQARWSAPPPQLIRQRLRERLARDRTVLNLNESSALARSSGAMPRVMRIELEEFSHHFDSPSQSAGVLRLRVTLMENTAAGEKVIGQRAVAVREPASTPDAPGGVRALAAATDAAAEEIRQFLAQAR